MSKGRRGIYTSTIKLSPERRKQEAEKRRREEERWAKRCGPVVIRRIDSDPKDAL